MGGSDVAVHGEGTITTYAIPVGTPSGLRSSNFAHGKFCLDKLPRLSLRIHGSIDWQKWCNLDF